ncbi:hypothetical protein FE243_06980 [Aliarcobacter thereius]|uniref:Uncharacterized protein n=1 Tax=Aliarcobacter thereius TaxID=544718 RepID=A0A5R9H3U2_9BACT|nr:hypothetical protein [Aliarcobacter thereius]TLS71034.1 hypothetical protein FE246_08705 [Aliarcobacter thereius]TLT06638.1 hypothetical protein FE243_06980 [Aliarcobacter thereius]
MTKESLKNKRTIDDLSEDELKQFIDEYYNSDLSVQKVIEKYKLNILPSKIKSYLPEIKVDFLCPFCDIEMYEEAKSRTEYKDSQKYKNINYFRTNKNSIFCKECGHKDDKNEFNQFYCNCDNCIQHKKMSEELKIKKAKKYTNEIINSQKESSISIEEIKNNSIIEKTYLLTLLLYLYDDKKHIFKPISTLDGIKFSPSIELGFEMINNLLGYMIRFKDTPNIHNHVYLKEGNSSFSYEQYNCTYSLNLCEDMDINFTKLVTLCETNDYCEGIEDDALELWLKIAKEELKEYLFYLFEKYNFNKDYIGDAILEKLELILEDFSVSEGYSILYSSVSGSASYKQTGISHRQAINSINSYIANNIAKRKSGEWKTKGYGRNYDLPQTAISMVFFNNILKIGESGFTLIPKLENIPKFYNNNVVNKGIDSFEIEDVEINSMLYENLYKVLDRIITNDILPPALNDEAKILFSSNIIMEDYEYSIKANELLKFISKLKGFDIR